MNAKYYITKIWWGAIMWAVAFYNTLYSRRWDELSNREQTVLTLSSINFILFPFSYKVIEILGIKYTPAFWENQCVNENTPSKFFSVIIPMICFILAIPLSLTYPLIARNKKAN